jgi:putative tryptophan/tyrosine transport system substrate-binding protein
MATDSRGLHLSRRQFVQGAGVAGLGLLAGCAPAFSQPARQLAPPAPLARIGFIAFPGATALVVDAERLRQSLAAEGYVEGANLLIEWRFGEGSLERYDASLAELLTLRPQVIVVPSAGDALRVSDRTTTIPVVVSGLSGDLMQLGLVTSLARPGGNVTGINNPDLPLDGKRLQLMIETLPGASQVLFVMDFRGRRNYADQLDRYQEFARALGVQAHLMDLQRLEDLDTIVRFAASQRVDALHVGRNPFTLDHRTQIITALAAHGLPTIYGDLAFVHEGGLMAYRPSLDDSARRTAAFVAKILRGAQPAELPVENPTRFDFAINLQTAQALGLTIPQHVLLQATEVIQ